jgi:hypothetical protein
MAKKLPILSFLLFIISLFTPSSILAHRSGINIGTNYGLADQAISVVGSGGWLVVIAGGTGDCETLQQIIDKTNSANVNLIIRGHLGNYLTPPDALGWTATLGELNTHGKKIYFMPWNEPNQTGTADYGDPQDVIAYTNALNSELQNSCVNGKVTLLSPMINQSHGNFSSYIDSLGSGSYFSQFEGIAMNLYDFGEAVCGQPLCSDSPYLNPARFNQILQEMGVSGKPAYGVESGTAGAVFYWRMPPSSNSPLYRFVDKFLDEVYPEMFAIPAYDLGGEVGHTWTLFTPPDVTSLLASQSGGGTTPASFNQACFQNWLDPLVENGTLISCNGCGYAHQSNPGLCTASGSPSSYPPGKTDLTYCIGLDKGKDHGAEVSSPILVGETVTYWSNEEGTTPASEEEGEHCFDVNWTGQLTFVEETFELPWAYYLNEYFIGPIDVHRLPPEITDPLQLKIKDMLYMTGPIYKTTPQRMQDKLKNDFLKETIDLINVSRVEGEALTAYISKDLQEVYQIGPWTIEEIYYEHNVYKIRNNFYQCLANSPLQNCRSILAQIDEMTDSVWQMVPFFPNEKTRGKITLSSVDMQFDPDPVRTKNPEVYRLNNITKFLKDQLLAKQAIIPGVIKEGVYGDAGGIWEIREDGSICYDATNPDADDKESAYLTSIVPSSADFEFEVTLNFGHLRTHMAVHYRASIDENIQENYTGSWPEFAGFKSYSMALIPTKDELQTKHWKTTPPDYLLNDPTLIEQVNLPGVTGGGYRTSYRIKIVAQGTHFKTFVDMNNNGQIEEDTELVYEFDDSDFSFGGIAFSIYDPKDSVHCFSDYSISPISQGLLWQKKNKNNTTELLTSLKNKISKTIKTKTPERLKNLLAATKLFQPASKEPASNLLAQSYSGVPGGCFYYYGDSWGDCSCMSRIKEDGNPECRGDVGGCCPAHWWWGVCAYTDCQPELRCGDPDAWCEGVPYFGGGPIPVAPGECETPASYCSYPDPEAIYDPDNYTPDLCFYDNTVDVTGERSVKNECNYRTDPETGIEVPQQCTKSFISCINVTNFTPWMETVKQQTLDLASGLFRIWDPPSIYQETSGDSPFRPIPAKDQVGYGYSHSGGDPRISTFMAQEGPWDLLFAYLGGVVNAQKWLVNKALNPLAGQVNLTLPAPTPPPEPPSTPGPIISPTPTPAPTPPSGEVVPPPNPLPPPPAPGISPPPGQLACAQPVVSQVEDPENRNYVFGNYTGPLERQIINDQINAHSDRPYLATIVSWSDRNFRFVFSQEAGANDPFFEFSDGSAVRFQFYEGAHGSGELFNRWGRLYQNSFVEIYSQDPLIIKWEYYDVNSADGRRVNHAVEYYTFYPCGLVAREMKFLASYEENGYSYEPIEAILLNPVGTRWYDHIQPTENWYHTLTLYDIYSESRRDHYARPIDLNSSEVRETGVDIEAVENMVGKIFNLHMRQGEVFLIYGDRSGLPNEDILDVGKNWGHPCFDHGIIGWINSEWHKCDEQTFAFYPNATPIIGINHQPQNDANGQHNYTLLGVVGPGVASSSEELRQLGQQWLENTDFQF